MFVTRCSHESVVTEESVGEEDVPHDNVAMMIHVFKICNYMACARLRKYAAGFNVPVHSTTNILGLRQGSAEVQQLGKNLRAKSMGNDGHCRYVRRETERMGAQGQQSTITWLSYGPKDMGERTMVVTADVCAKGWSAWESQSSTLSTTNLYQMRWRSQENVPNLQRSVVAPGNNQGLRSEMVRLEASP